MNKPLWTYEYSVYGVEFCQMWWAPALFNDICWALPNGMMRSDTPCLDMIVETKVGLVGKHDIVFPRMRDALGYLQEIQEHSEER